MKGKGGKGKGKGKKEGQGEGRGKENELYEADIVFKWNNSELSSSQSVKIMLTFRIRRRRLGQRSSRLDR